MTAQPPLTSEGMEARAAVSWFVVPERVRAPTIETFFDEVGARTRDVGPGRLVVDARAMVAIDPLVRRVVYRRHKEIRGWRVAVLVRSTFQRLILNFFLHATAARSARPFTEEDTALSWLGEEAGERHG